MIAWLRRDRPLYVEVDANTLKAAEQREAREMDAGSYVVSKARRDHRAFWRAVDFASEAKETLQMRGRVDSR